MKEGKIRVALVGAGDFGRNHARVWRELPEAELVAVVDIKEERARQVAAEFGAQALVQYQALVGRVDAACVAVPTTEHVRIATWLVEHGIDVLVEKPMAPCLPEADALIDSAASGGRILQVGHVERFNPAVAATEKIVSQPLFFEVHRLGIFSPRSLDVDVIFDVMIHDLDIVATLAGGEVTDLKAVGIPVLTDKVDIAHARLEFSTGAVANLTASRVSTERVRKMRFFQEHEYVSVDYARRDVLRVRVRQGGPQPQFDFEKLPTVPEEPLHAELREFAAAVRERRPPRVDGWAGRRALGLAERVMASVREHADRLPKAVQAKQAVQ